MVGIGSGVDFLVGKFFGGDVFFGAKVLRHGPEVQRGDESAGVWVVGVHPVGGGGIFLEKNEMMGMVKMNKR